MAHPATNVSFELPAGWRDLATDIGTTRGKGAAPRDASPSEASATADTASAALASWLADDDLEVAAERTIEVDSRSAIRPAPGRVRATVEPGQQALLLIEDGGLFRWKLPREETASPTGDGEGGVQKGGTRGSGGAVASRRVVSFDLNSDALATDDEHFNPEGTRSRGLELTKLLGPPVRMLTTRLLTFAAGEVMQRGVRWYEERSLPEGPVIIDRPDPIGWTRNASNPELVPTGSRTRRVLLFVHGTFSSTAGSFGDLGRTAAGRGLLETAARRYDRVVGLDHHSLGVDPAHNARDLTALLRTLCADGELVVDAVGFSRGGLVLRDTIEQCAEAGLRVRFEKLVFVACANRGTGLARHKNWHDLVDVTTSLAVAGARIIGTIIPTAITPKFFAAAIPGVGSFVKFVATAGLRADGVPGLAAMDPDGAFITARRAAPRWLPSSARCHTVTSTFETDLLRELPPEAPLFSALGQRLKGLLAEGFMRRLMRGAANDLVVDVESMRSLGETDLSDSHDFGAQNLVFHTSYFRDEKTVEQLGRWLGVGAPAHA